MLRMVPAMLHRGQGAWCVWWGQVSIVCVGGYICTGNPACSSAQERARCTFVANIFGLA